MYAVGVAMGQVSVMDRDMTRKDESLGELFIPVSFFKEPKVWTEESSIWTAFSTPLES